MLVEPVVQFDRVALTVVRLHPPIDRRSPMQGRGRSLHRTLAVATLLVTLGLASPAGARTNHAVNLGYRHVLQLEAARDARMTAREHPRPAEPFERRSSQPVIFGTVR